MDEMKWYESKTGNHQGLIIDEITGDNIAVSYDKKHAAMIAAAPDLLKASKMATRWIGKMIADNGHLASVSPSNCVLTLRSLENAIAKAEGRE